MKYDFKTRVNRKEQGSIKWEDMFNKKEAHYYCKRAIR